MTKGITRGTVLAQVRAAAIPPKIRSMGALMDRADEIQWTRGQEKTIEMRVSRLEREHSKLWKLLAEMTYDALENGPFKPTDEPAKASEIPPILDRRSFLAHVAAVTHNLHAKKLTGAEARAMLYAAQLAYAALKGGPPDAITEAEQVRQLP